MRCPCGRSAALEACCGRFIQGWEQPTTAEELMRSRYTAYATGEVDYLLTTHHPTPDRPGVADFAKRARFTSLDIREVIAGGEHDDAGIVEFIAHFEQDGAPRLLHERSSFQRKEGRWMYIDTDAQKEKVGRNDPCPCGSGKKFKKCHGA